jgi:sugar phosphate isomerase/epimerase
MKLGVAGRLPRLDEPLPAFLPGDWRMITAEDAARVRAHGFVGSSLFINKPLEAEAEDVKRVGQAFKEGGLEIAQLNGWYESLCNYDDTLRAQGVAGMIALARVGAALQAPSVYVRPGGHNPKGHWYAHPENHTQRTFDLVVDSLRQVCKAAEQDGVFIAVEGHVLSCLDTPQRIRDLVDAVGSPALKFNYDPVNFTGTVKQVHDTRIILQQLKALMGPFTIAAHAKDCALGDHLVVHIEEVVPGTGTMNYEMFMKDFQALAPEGYFIIEHLPDAETLEAQKNVVALAKRYGVPLDV